MVGGNVGIIEGTHEVGVGCGDRFGSFTVGSAGGPQPTSEPTRMTATVMGALLATRR
jgi:hypothetical protein